METLKKMIPLAHLSRIIYIKNNLFWIGRKSYSQFGEDLLIAKLLKKKHGFYVDVGAYHPKHYSNTHLLYKKGWHGINIDPNPDAIKLFNIYRKNDSNVLSGVSDKNEVLTYYSFSHANWNTFSEEKMRTWLKKSGVRFLGKQQVPCVPLKYILKEHLPNNTKIELLNIDVEGFDLAVLHSNDWGKYIPRVIVIESAEFNPDSPQTNEIYSFLKNKSYVLYAFMGKSLVFVST